MSLKKVLEISNYYKGVLLLASDHNILWYGNKIGKNFREF